MTRHGTIWHDTARNGTNRHEPTKKKLSVHLKNHYFDFLSIFTPSRLFHLKNFRSSYKNLQSSLNLKLTEGPEDIQAAIHYQWGVINSAKD